MALAFLHGGVRGDARLTTESGYLTTPDGVRLFYTRIGNAAPVAVLLHGGPGSNINAVWPDLEPLGRGQTVLMYDQRGGGRSQIITDPARLSAALHVSDLEAVRAHFQLNQMMLIGESWGAGLATLYAAKYPERVERLLLLGPMPPTRELLDRRMGQSDEAMGFRARLAEIVRAMPDSQEPEATCRTFFAAYLPQFFARPENVSRRRGDSCNAPPEGVRNYFVVNQATFASLGEYDLRPTLGRLRMPALVIEGAKSIPSTVESARVFAQFLSNGKLELIPEAGHYPQVERPDEFFPLVERFLRGGGAKQ